MNSIITLGVVVLGLGLMAVGVQVMASEALRRHGRARALLRTARRMDHIEHSTVAAIRRAGAAERRRTR